MSRNNIHQLRTCNEQMIHGVLVKRPRRWHFLPTTKAEIAFQIDADADDITVADCYPGIKRLGTIATIRFNAEMTREVEADWDALNRERLDNLARIERDFHWHEVALSDCEHGCKVYARTNNGVRETQLMHSLCYGCHKDDGPVIREQNNLGTRLNVYGYNQPTVEHHAPARKPVAHFANGKAREGSLPQAGRSVGKYTANFDIESPSLHQMAQARAKALGL